MKKIGFIFIGLCLLSSCGYSSPEAALEGEGGVEMTLKMDCSTVLSELAINPNNAEFQEILAKCNEAFREEGGLFPDLFQKHAKLISPSTPLARWFDHELLEISRGATDEDVVDALHQQLSFNLNATAEILRTRLDRFGVIKPGVSVNEMAYLLEVIAPGIKDDKTLMDKAIAQANVEFRETFETEELAGFWRSIVHYREEPEIDTLATMNDTLGEPLYIVSEPQPTYEKSILTELEPGYDMAFASARPDIVPTVDAYLARPEIKSLFPENLEFMWSDKPEESTMDGSQRFFLYAIKKEMKRSKVLGTSYIVNATDSYNSQTGEITVSISFNSEGSERFAELTRDNVGRSIAITMDGVVYSAPRVMSEIYGGNVEISGSFSKDEAESLANLISTGAYPAPFVIIKSSVVK